MTTKERYDGVIAWFSEHMPVAESELHYTDPYQLLVAVILSAQCTDKRVNMTTPALFERFPTPFEMAKATAEEIYPYIRSISYPNNKARNLAGMARMLCEEFGGEVPSDLQQMQRLPGVGRKTANVLGAVLWQKEVMPVHACLPCLEPYRADDQFENSVADRADARKEHPFAPVAGGSPLADPPRTLRLHGAQPQVRRMRDRRLVPQIRRRPPDERVGAPPRRFGAFARGGFAGTVRSPIDTPARSTAPSRYGPPPARGMIRPPGTP